MRFLERAWYNKAPWLWLLWPLSLIFQLIVSIRGKRKAVSSSSGNGVPVIVVGNLTVGGTGKTPLLIALCNHLQKLGMKPGVISRGYGGSANNYPMDVDSETDPALAGDEPVLIASKTSCPVVVDPDRARALQHLTGQHNVDLVLSDDGLQHYRLRRDMEIVVVDGQRLFGNGLCLPAGPLREPVSRLQHSDFIVINGEPQRAIPELSDASVMQIKSKALINLETGERKPFSGAPFHIGNKVQAVAAIGNPKRFFDSLATLPYPVEPHVFPDHHAFRPADFEALDPHQPIVMTEKDGIKCHNFASANMWYVEIDVDLPQALLSGMVTQLKR